MTTPVLDLMFRVVAWLVLAILWLGWLEALYSGKVRAKFGPPTRRDTHPADYWLGIGLGFALYAGVTVFLVWTGALSR